MEKVLTTEPKKILWLSRHDMSAKQYEELETAFGEITVIQHRNEVKNADEILSIGEGCDVYAVILPPRILQELFQKSKFQKSNVRIIRPVMNRGIIETTRCGPQVTLTHDYWERIVEMNIVTEKLIAGRK